MTNAFRLGAVWNAAVLAFAACSNSPNGAGDDAGLSGIGGDGAVVGSDEGGSSLDSAMAASSSSGSSSGSPAGSSSGSIAGSSSSSSGTSTSSSSSSSGAGASSSSSGGNVDAGCGANCDRVKACCPLVAMGDAGSLLRLCNSAAMSCKDSLCTQFLSLSLGTCP